MRLYTVKYKKTNAWFWKTLKRVKGDGAMQQEVGAAYRWFIMENDERLEIPMDDMIFLFSNDRFLNIKENMEKQAGQTIPVASS